MTVIRQKVELPKAKYIKYSEAKVGQTLVLGTFLGTKMVPNFDKDAEVPSHTFETDEGTVILNSASSLDRLLTTVEPGTPLEITFLGKEKKKNKTGKSYSQNAFEVNILVEE
jgi:hypothetical protein